MSAIDKFLRRYPLQMPTDGRIRVVVGIRRYACEFPGMPLAVVDGAKSSVPLYQELGDIAFMVSGWICVPASLEGVCNLLFGHENTLCALALLRRLNVSPVDLADALWTRSRLLLVNRWNAGEDRQGRIATFLEGQRGTSIYGLLAGDDAQKGWETGRVGRWRRVYHPSSNNRSTSKGERYWREWIFPARENGGDGVSLDTFRVIPAPLPEDAQTTEEI